jgi:hypothetical protein
MSAVVPITAHCGFNREAFAAAYARKARGF